MSAARWRLCALLASMVLGSPRGALATEPPMSPDARTWYDEAMSLYAARDYRAAISAFEAAYALDPRREILFAQAQATRLAGDCAAALPLYQRFLATQPPPQQVEATRIALARCATAASAPLPPPPSPPLVVTPLPPAPPRWFQDRAGGILIGAGLVGVGAGAALLASASATDADARAITSRWDLYRSQRETAESRWRWGLVSLAAGSGLLAAGVGRYVWVVVHPQGVGVRGRF